MSLDLCFGSSGVYDGAVTVNRLNRALLSCFFSSSSMVDICNGLLIGGGFFSNLHMFEHSITWPCLAKGYFLRFRWTGGSTAGLFTVFGASSVSCFGFNKASVDG